MIIINKEPLCSFHPYVQFLTQVYDEQPFKQLYDIFQDKYRTDYWFSQIVWITLALSKTKNSYEELLDKAIIGEKPPLEWVPIPKIRQFHVQFHKEEIDLSSIKYLLNKWSIPPQIEDEEFDDDLSNKEGQPQGTTIKTRFPILKSTYNELLKFVLE